MPKPLCPHIAIKLVAAVALVSLSATTRVAAAETLTSGINQLVVIPPGVHERGLPGVRLEPSANGELTVDVPPTLHIHRFFYDGDREYQGPIVHGGPHTVVANHPATGERMYVDVSLPAGSPTIAYSKKCITYVYPDRRVSIRFGRWNHQSVKVHYYSGRGVGRRTRELASHFITKSQSALRGSSTVQSIADASKAGTSTLAGAKNAVDSAAGFVVDGLTSVVKVIPGVSTLSSMGNQASQSAYESEVRGLAREKKSSAIDFIRTNR
ncbi:MAG: hypothetical protein AAF802_29075 [Planctomycetota bacterium]